MVVHLYERHSPESEELMTERENMSVGFNQAAHYLCCLILFYLFLYFHTDIISICSKHVFTGDEPHTHPAHLHLCISPQIALLCLIVFKTVPALFLSEGMFRFIILASVERDVAKNQQTERGALSKYPKLLFLM